VFLSVKLFIFCETRPGVFRNHLDCFAWNSTKHYKGIELVPPRYDRASEFFWPNKQANKPNPATTAPVASAFKNGRISSFLEAPTDTFKPLLGLGGGFASAAISEVKRLSENR
jgi:hypothetical protein